MFCCWRAARRDQAGAGVSLFSRAIDTTLERGAIPAFRVPTVASRPPNDGRPAAAEELLRAAPSEWHEPSEDDCSVTSKRADRPRLENEVDAWRSDLPS